MERTICPQGIGDQQTPACGFRMFPERLALGVPLTQKPDARILIIDDLDLEVRMLTALLESAGYRSVLGETDPCVALKTIEISVPDLIVLDLHMPSMSGVELLLDLKRTLPRRSFPAVLVVTADHSIEARRRALAAGARDFVSKPFDTIEVLLRIGNLLEVQLMHEQLARRVHEATREIAETRDIALVTLATLADSRDPVTGRHLNRMAAYCRAIASALRGRPEYPEVDGEFIEQIERSSTLHDIGKVGIPDSILTKNGALTEAERTIMQSHTRIGGDTLSQVVASYPEHTFLSMGTEVAYQHHERWDGTGYPLGLRGRQISLAARIVSLVDAYDAITSDRPYKAACSHREALRRITEDSGTHFDPHLVGIFLEVADELDGLRLADNPVRMFATSSAACPGE